MPHSKASLEDSTRAEKLVKELEPPLVDSWNRGVRYLRCLGSLILLRKSSNSVCRRMPR